MHPMTSRPRVADGRRAWPVSRPSHAQGRASRGGLERGPGCPTHRYTVWRRGLATPLGTRAVSSRERGRAATSTVVRKSPARRWGGGSTPSPTRLRSSQVTWPSSVVGRPAPRRFGPWARECRGASRRRGPRGCRPQAWTAVRPVGWRSSPAGSTSRRGLRSGAETTRVNGSRAPARRGVSGAGASLRGGSVRPGVRRHR